MNWEGMDTVAQVGIVVSAYVTPHLKASKKNKTRMWGFIFGMCVTPLWLFTGLWPTLKIGIVLANISYTFSYARGIWNNLDRNQIE